MDALPDAPAVPPQALAKSHWQSFELYRHVSLEPEEPWICGRCSSATSTLEEGCSMCGISRADGDECTYHYPRRLGMLRVVVL